MKAEKFIERVTVTGADDSVTYEDLEQISQEFPFVEFGILVSLDNFGTCRFPSLEWLQSIPSKMAREERANARNTAPVKLSGHICGQMVRDILQGKVSQYFTHKNFMTERESTILKIGNSCNRFQLNTHAQFHEFHALWILEFLKGLYSSGVNIIFQYDGANNGAIQHIIDNCAMVSTPKLVGQPKRVGNIDVLFDVSHGAGILPSSWPNPYMWIDKEVNVGFAGGLSPDNVEENLFKIQEQFPGLRPDSGSFPMEVWIDAETHLRSGHDSKFDLEKVRAFLKASEKFIWKDWVNQ